MNYYQKYLKYKNKYIILKNQLGSSPSQKKRRAVANELAANPHDIDSFDFDPYDFNLNLDPNHSSNNLFRTKNDQLNSPKTGPNVVTRESAANIDSFNHNDAFQKAVDEFANKPEINFDWNTDNGELSSNSRQLEDMPRINYSGGVYQGKLKDNIPDGFGIFKDADSTYIGNFIDGQPNGSGTLAKNGNFVNAEFINGQPNGFVLASYNGNEEYEGYFTNGSPNGFGKLSKNGSIYEGNFINGRLNGIFKITYNGSIYEQNFTNSEPVGILKEITDNNNVEDRIMTNNIELPKKPSFIPGEKFSEKFGLK